MGLIAETEAAVNAILHSCNVDDTETILLVDTSNAFNSLNWKTALLFVRSLCTSFASILVNSYREETQLFVDECTIYFQEGISHGDHLAMPMYAIAIFPLIHRVTVS